MDAGFLALTVFSCFLLSAILPLIQSRIENFTHWLCSGFLGAIFVVFWLFAPDVFDGKTIHMRLPWADSLGIYWAFSLDGLSLFFSLLISGIGAPILFYSGPYFHEKSGFGRFCAFMLMFAGSMLGLVLAADLITMYVFWELTTVSSFLLIGFNHADRTARQAAKKALLVTSAAGLFLLAGFVLLGIAAGTNEISEIIADAGGIKSHRYYTPIVLLFLIGAFTKSAQFPFHFWLPAAMSAPAPVSAFLHSATMVKAGIFLLARFSPMLSGTALWSQSLITVGAITMIVSVFMALQERDIKLILAYLTVTVLGLLVVLLGIPEKKAIEAFLVYLLAHALYKAALFMNAGIIDHAAGTRNIHRLQGIAQRLKAPTWSTAMAGLSMIGFVPFLGFVGKEAVYGVFSDSPVGIFFLSTVMAVMIATTGFICLQPFIGTAALEVKKVSSSFWISPFLLAALGLALGLWPSVLNDLIEAAVSSVTGSKVPADISLWHGFNREFFLSMGSAAFGVLLYVFLKNKKQWLESFKEPLRKFGPGTAYNLSVRGLNIAATFVTNTLQNGSLRFYLYVIALFFVGLTSFSLWLHPTLHWPQDWHQPHHYDWLATTLIVAGAIVAMIARSVLIIFIGLGASGYGLAMIYMLYSAPDLALTQFLVETMTVVMIAMVFVRLPSGIKKPPFRRRLGDLSVSLLFGATITISVWQTFVGTVNTEVADFYNRESFRLAHGKNVINVILVDFRALDTLGEATVLLLGAASVVSLYKLRPRKNTR